MSWICYGFVVIFSSSSSSSKEVAFVLVFGLVVAEMLAAPSEPLDSSSILFVVLDELRRSKSFFRERFKIRFCDELVLLGRCC